MLGARDADDWWGTALATAAAAVSLAKHPMSQRAESERAADRIQRWWRDEEPRRTSEDAAALALAARAHADLQRRNRTLDAAAASAIDALLDRDGLIFPELHLALASWALDELIPDRDEPPWPQMRARAAYPSGRTGIQEPLRQYIVSVAAREYDAGSAARSLVSSIGSTPSPTDGCVVVWLITAALEKLRTALPASDNALSLLLQRRADIVDHLAGLIDDATFVEPDAQLDAEVLLTYLTSFEALLLDLGLASRSEPEGWFTQEEAEALLGAGERSAKVDAARTRSRLLRVIAGLLAAEGITAAILTRVIATAAGASEALANSASIAVGASTAVVAITALARDPARPGWLGELGVFATLFALLAWVTAVNQALPQPIVSDLGGLLIGTIIAAAAALLWRFVSGRPDA